MDLFIFQIAILGTNTEGLSASTAKDGDSEKQAPPTGDNQDVATTPGESSSVNPTGKRCIVYINFMEEDDIGVRSTHIFSKFLPLQIYRNEYLIQFAIES